MASSSTTLCLLLFLAILAHSRGKFGRIKETRMSVYYQDYSGGSNPSMIQITGPANGPFNFSKFGSTFVTDDLITVGFDKGSAQVARGQGVAVTSALDGSKAEILMSIVFTNGKYKGSTLQLQGSDPQFERVREVSVVGGTGKFRFARGYVTFETLHFDSASFHAVIQCNVTVLHY